MHRTGSLRLSDVPLLLRVAFELARYFMLRRGRSYVELARRFDAHPIDRIVPMAIINRNMAITTSALEFILGARSELPRSYVLFRLLRESGIPVSICLGFDGNGLRTPKHAWLTLGNRPFREHRTATERYRFQYSYPQPTS